ncbi:LANO_0F16512g1_1 [Lachancea nothofagi CBS 11611]|uniref:LANO_0F16512g1_1 n=1 Tax=Lachancea nothofagi CBS 11611 TaxID=1266666 RepID=A0A1G4KCV6_9SACH|nr:LANO_0F16512g1_1 [Lachancea nothofagi CBS 11611]
MSVCQPSAMARLVAQTDRIQGAGVRRGLAHAPNRQSAAGLEAQFRAGAASNDLTAGAAIAPQLVSNVNGTFASQDASWSDQFSRMQIRDPLSFTSEYQQLYKNYEQQQHERLQHQSQLPVHQPMPLHRPILATQQPFYAASDLPTQSHEPHESHESLSSQTDFFAREFEDIERELQDETPSTPSQPPALTPEQLKFRQAASEIHQRLSPGSQTPPQLESKFQNSKFLGLMRSISSGVVTLKSGEDDDRKYTHLYSPTTGEVVGNDYFPVPDTTLNV